MDTPLSILSWFIQVSTQVLSFHLPLFLDGSPQPQQYESLSGPRNLLVDPKLVVNIENSFAETHHSLIVESLGPLV